MKFLFVLQHLNFFRNLVDVARKLCERGHSVTVLYGGRKVKLKIRTLDRLVRGFPEVVVRRRVDELERSRGFLRTGRYIVNTGLFCLPGHPGAARIDLTTAFVPPALRQVLERPGVQKCLSSPRALRLWRRLEMATPASRILTALMQELDPDLLLVSPSIWPKKPVETDYIRAAQSCGIPTIAYVNSWDNLTSKGAIHVIPDLLLVWNQAMAEEAMALHQVPRERIRLVGAPHLDNIFAGSPSVERDELGRRLGVGPGARFASYLCSSSTLVRDETATVSDLADALAIKPETTNLWIVVRPHPTNPKPWHGFSRDRVLVWPHDGEMADTPEAWQSYFDILHHSLAVVGLNTSAFIEAASAGAPCLCLRSEEHWGAQARTGHFRHLLDGGFMEVRHDVAGLATSLARLTAGQDVKRDARQRFLEAFVRPCGMDVAASDVIVDLLEDAARRRDLQDCLALVGSKRTVRRSLVGELAEAGPRTEAWNDQ